MPEHRGHRAHHVAPKDPSLAAGDRHVRRRALEPPRLPTDCPRRRCRKCSGQAVRNQTLLTTVKALVDGSTPPGWRVLRHRPPCVVCASVRRSPVTSCSSTAAASGALEFAWASSPARPRTVQSSLQPRRPERPPPRRHPPRDSTVCTFGPNRRSRARCARVVQSSEKAWLSVLSPSRSRTMRAGAAAGGHRVGRWPPVWPHTTRSGESPGGR